ncbi:hypothetical protein [Nocardia gamkensis]|uniref:Uncharacterized protein n=1 Tax=Nocardia gamkensis TaxID=352869 RepID=A0A7X6L4K9_9NOCA|nr:hypothetical protein [Nocardia gamkensis]NKY27734.1 hypothetical protein [Nocardia gamkensis]NQE67371.1 hypothetical protein [Nocardia gamkensis]
MVDESVSEDPQQVKLKEFGFDASETVYPFRPEADLPKRLSAALVGSLYDEPVSVRIVVHEDLAFNVVASSIRVVYEPHRFTTDDYPLGCWRRPNLYVEGWLLKSGFDPYAEIVRVRLYLDYISEESGDGYIQRLSDNPDPGSTITVFN